MAGEQCQQRKKLIPGTERCLRVQGHRGAHVFATGTGVMTAYMAGLEDAPAPAPPQAEPAPQGREGECPECHGTRLEKVYEEHEWRTVNCRACAARAGRGA